jgi:hypothetical protein
VKRYKLNPIIIAPPNKGFLIQTPTGKTLFDTRPRGIVRELNAAAAEIERLTNKVAQLYEGAEEAKQRIKRLEEAGDALCENSNPSRWDSPADTARKLTDQSNWNKAKEAK